VVRPAISAATVVAGVTGDPIAHSLSPLIHNAWIKGAGLDAVYVALPVSAEGFAKLVRGFRGGVIRGLNVTAPFKGAALALADRASPRAERAGAANLLVFEPAGVVSADNTDGEGLLAAFAEQAPGFDAKAGPVVVLGAGGAARGAVAAFLDAGAPCVRLVNRSRARAAELAAAFGKQVMVVERAAAALADASAIINATPSAPDLPWAAAPRSAVVMDMVYRPLVTHVLADARAAGLRTVDGLAMLIGQARPSFRALFGVEPPGNVNVRALAVAALGRNR
jgi:shikimate dehydrogenase